MRHSARAAPANRSTVRGASSSATRPAAGRPPVEAALARGIHVYLEKPIARTLADAEAIVRAREAGL